MLGVALVLELLFEPQAEMLIATARAAAIASHIRDMNGFLLGRCVCPAGSLSTTGMLLRLDGPDVKSL